MCELIWDNSFVYEEDSNEGYVWSWDADEPNPNHKINLHVTFPDPCPKNDFPMREEVCGEEAVAHPDIIPHTCHLCQVRCGGVVLCRFPRVAEVSCAVCSMVYCIWILCRQHVADFYLFLCFSFC